MAVRHGKVIMQDAADLYSWASCERDCIDYWFINVQDYEESENILANLMVNIQVVKDTIKVHAMKSAKHPNKIKVWGTSCYYSNYYDGTSLCDGWREVELVCGKAQEQVNDYLVS